MLDTLDLDSLFLQLDKVKQTNEHQWLACCPAHNDKTPSLSIGIGINGKILLYCHAGCQYKDIIKALYLTNS